MNVHYLASMDLDRFPQLAAYQNQRERALRGESLFISEGDLVTQRLLESPFQVESFLVMERFLHRVESLLSGELTDPDTPVYVLPELEAQKLIGFPFHRGIMALGRRRVPWNLRDLLESIPSRSFKSDSGADSKDISEPSTSILTAASSQVPIRWVVLPDITEQYNLGIVFRCAAALGVHAVLLGPRACDPLARRTLRASMGGSLQIPWVRSECLADDLEMMRHEYGFTCVATVLDPSAVSLDQYTWPSRAAILFGNEFTGLLPEHLEHCDTRLTISMRAGVDSLNLGVSAGIFLYASQRNQEKSWSVPDTPCS